MCWCPNTGQRSTCRQQGRAHSNSACPRKANCTATNPRQATSYTQPQPFSSPPPPSHPAAVHCAPPPVHRPPPPHPPTPTQAPAPTHRHPPLALADRLHHLPNFQETLPRRRRRRCRNHVPVILLLLTPALPGLPLVPPWQLLLLPKVVQVVTTQENNSAGCLLVKPGLRVGRISAVRAGAGVLRSEAAGVGLRGACSRRVGHAWAAAQPCHPRLIQMLAKLA